MSVPGVRYVYCDESHVDGFQYRVQGGIWVREEGMREVRRQFDILRAKHPTLTEFKWEYVSGSTRRGCYHDLVDLFFNSPATPHMRYNALVVARQDDASLGEDRHTRDLAFYKAYFTLLRYRLAPGNHYHLLIDGRSSPRHEPEEELRRCLNNAAARDVSPPFRVLSCKAVDSKKEDLVQLADVLSGLLAWAWNGMKSRAAAKPILHEHVCRALGRSTMVNMYTPKDAQKFNVWKFTPRQRQEVGAPAA